MCLFVGLFLCVLVCLCFGSCVRLLVCSVVRVPFVRLLVSLFVCLFSVRLLVCLFFCLLLICLRSARLSGCLSVYSFACFRFV